MIYNTANNKRYYGETSNLSSRIAGHKYRLRNNLHGCKPLQEDWNLFGEAVFDVVILHAGSDWANVEKREQRETELILADVDLVYNVGMGGKSRPGKSNPFYGKMHSQETRNKMNETRHKRKERLEALAKEKTEQKPMRSKAGIEISINGTVYKSLREASRVLEIHRSKIRDYADDPANLDYYYIGSAKDPNWSEVKQTDNMTLPSGRPFKEVFAKGVVYPSISEASRVLEMGRKVLQRLVDHPTNLDYYYIGSNKDPESGKT